MIFSKSAYDERAARAKEIAADLTAQDIRFIEMQFPDMNGMMRGKYTPLAKGLSASGTGVSCLLYSARGGDQLTIDFWADFDNGFPKIVGLPDYDTVAQRVQQFIDAGFNHIIPQTVTPGTPRDVQHRWSERFAREVAPRFSSAFTSQGAR